MKQIYKLISIFMILILTTQIVGAYPGYPVTPISSNVYLKTDKSTYNQGEIVGLTISNYNRYPITIIPSIQIQKNVGTTWNTVYTSAYVCVDLADYNCNVTVSQYGGKYTTSWNQKIYVNGQSVQAAPGIYRAYVAGYKSNIFTIKQGGDIVNCLAIGCPTNIETTIQ